MTAFLVRTKRRFTSAFITSMARLGTIPTPLICSNMPTEPGLGNNKNNLLNTIYKEPYNLFSLSGHDILELVFFTIVEFICLIFVVI